VGCASCHIPYSNEGFYEGNDSSIPKDKRGHLLTHQIQSSRKVNVSIHDINYSGIPVKPAPPATIEVNGLGYPIRDLWRPNINPHLIVRGNSQPKLHTQTGSYNLTEGYPTYSKGGWFGAKEWPHKHKRKCTGGGEFNGGGQNLGAWGNRRAPKMGPGPPKKNPRGGPPWENFRHRG